MTTRLAQVFVAGGVPDVTYTPRSAAGLEDAINDYLDEGGSVFFVTGPSKTGKTVLLERTVPDAVFLNGGQVDSAMRFWALVLDALGGFTEESVTIEESEGDEEAIALDAAFKPGRVGASRTRTETSSRETATNRKQTVTTDAAIVAQKLLRDTDRVLVVDDFHHVAPEIQSEIVLALRPLILKTLRVIFVGVPHHAADVVSAQSEMEGRVDSTQVGEWRPEELAEIANRGFPALNIRCADELRDELVRHAMRSPHLMQLLCRELCKRNGIRIRVEEEFELQPPAEWAPFLGEIARRHTADSVLRALAQGPQSRKARIERRLLAGGKTDTYGAILTAVAHTGPLQRLSYDQLREALNAVLVKDSVPQKNEVTSSLRHLSVIARRAATDEYGRLTREPVLEYVSSDEALYVSDPYLAFRMRWGPDPLEVNSWHEERDGTED